MYFGLVTHFCFAFCCGHFSSESDVFPALCFTNRVGFVFENNRYRTMCLLSHPVIIFLRSPFFFKPLFFSNRGNCSGRIHRNLRTCMDRERAKTSSRHIIRASSCSLFTHVPCRVSALAHQHAHIHVLHSCSSAASGSVPERTNKISV